MRKPVDFRFFAITTIVTVLVVAFYCFNFHLQSSRPLLSKNLVSETATHQTGEFRPVLRKSLLIIGKGRSGTSFVSRMFGSGDRIFEVFEPLRFHTLENVEKLQVLRAFLSCRFTPSILWKKDYFPPFWYLPETKYYIKPSKSMACLKYRSGRRRCFPADKLFENFLDKCIHKFDSTVIKELSDRLPYGRLSSVIPEITQHTNNADIRVLHVVRDPRGSINSRIKLGWMPDYKSANFERKVQNYCDAIVENIEFGQQLDESLRHRYKLILYQDIAARPVDTAKEVFKFAGFNMSENTLRWIANRTDPDLNEATAKQLRKPYSLVRNSKANIDKWRNESPLQRTRMIERICQPLLELMEKIRVEREYLLI